MTTDTLWFSHGGRLLTSFENGYKPDATPLDTQGIPSAFGGLAFWNFTVTHNGGLQSANATVWFRVPANTVQWASNPNQPSCPYLISIGIAHEGSTTLHAMDCPPETNVIKPGGDVQVEFTFSIPVPMTFLVGDLIVLDVSATGLAPPPGTTIDVLSGAMPFESRVQVQGLLEPIQAAAGSLLVTT